MAAKFRGVHGGALRQLYLGVCPHHDPDLATTKYNHGTEFVDEFNTVILAIGRDACKAKIWLEGEGVVLNPKNGKVLHNELERSGVDNIYALSDMLVTMGCVYVCTTVREDD